MIVHVPEVAGVAQAHETERAAHAGRRRLSGVNNENNLKDMSTVSSRRKIARFKFFMRLLLQFQIHAAQSAEKVIRKEKNESLFLSQEVGRYFRQTQLVNPFFSALDEGIHCGLLVG